MTTDAFPLIKLLVIVLVPLVPSVVLHRFLRSQGKASGWLGKVRIQLSGPIASYFVLLVLAFYFHAVWDPPRTGYELWTLRGTAQTADKRPVELMPTDLQLSPQSVTVRPGGTFSVTFYTVPTAAGGESFPDFSVAAPGYESRTIRLDPQSLSAAAGTPGIVVDERTREIRMDGFVLKKQEAPPPYEPSKATIIATPVPIGAASAETKETH